MTRKSSKQLKFVAFIMSLVMLMTVAPLFAFAENGVIDTSEAIDQVLSGDEIISDVEPAAVDNVVTLTAADVPEFIAISDLTTRGTIRRVYEEESDLSTILFENNDGTRTLYMYGVPVKYVAPDGTTRDKSTAISSLSGLQPLWNGTTLTPGQMTTMAQTASIGRLELGQAAEALSLMNSRLTATYGATLKLSDMAYASLDSDIRSLYPTAVSDGVVLNYGDYSIRTIPVAMGSLVLPGAANVAESASLTDNDVRTRVRYSNAFGLGTILQYTPTTMGVKEEIILTSNVGKNSFSFRIETDGLTIQEENGNYYFFDPATQRVIAQLGEIIAYDSNGQIARGAVTVQSVIAGQRYNVTISVSPEFLANAAYPVSVDPTTTITASNVVAYIEDACVFDSENGKEIAELLYNTYSYRNVGNIGNTTYKSRALYKFPGLYTAGGIFDLFNISSSEQIYSFKFYARVTDSSNSQPSFAINAYSYEWLSNSNGVSSIDNDYKTNYVKMAYLFAETGEIEMDLSVFARAWFNNYKHYSDEYNFEKTKGIVVTNGIDNHYSRIAAVSQTPYAYAVLDYYPSEYVGTFYLNNTGVSAFLGQTYQILQLKTGLVESIGDTIAWDISYVGDNYYVIKQGNRYLCADSANNVSLLYTTSSIVPMDAKWKISYNSFQNYSFISATNNNYLCVTNNQVKVQEGTALTLDEKAWRVIRTSSYKELSDYNQQVVNRITAGERYSFSNIAGISGKDLCNVFDFELQGQTTYLSIEELTGVIIPQKAGTCQITFKHIPTNQNITVTVEIETIASGYYFLRNTVTGKFLTMTSIETAGAVQQQSFTNDDRVVWEFTWKNTGTYDITANSGILYLSANSLTSGAGVFTTDISSQTWTVTETTNNCYEICLTNDSSKFAIQATSATSNSVQMANATNGAPYCEWEAIPYAEYTVYHYYDEGFLLRYGQTAVSQIIDYQASAHVGIYQNTTPFIMKVVFGGLYTSIADDCKNNSDNIGNDAISTTDKLYLSAYSRPGGGTGVKNADCEACNKLTGSIACPVHNSCDDCDEAINGTCLTHKDCPHVANGDASCVSRDNIREKFIDYCKDQLRVPSNENLPKNVSCVLWTGHIMLGVHQGDEDTRSAANSSMRSVMMTPHNWCEPEEPYNNYTEETVPDNGNTFYTGATGTLAHEFSHQLGAPDHYCYLGYKSNNTEGTNQCENSNCFYCYHYKASDKSIVEGCLMMKSDNFSNADMYCPGCSETIQAYIRQQLQ